MLGSAEEADDAVQEAWLRLNRTGGDAIENLGGVAHHGRLAGLPERAAGAPHPARGRRSSADLDRPDHRGRDRPAARGAARRLGRARAARRPGHALARRARRVRAARPVRRVLRRDRRRSSAATRPPRASSPAAPGGASATRTRPEADRLRQAKLVDAFLAAARDGEFERLLALLDPEIVLTADPAAAQIGVADRSSAARRGRRVRPLRPRRDPRAARRRRRGRVARRRRAAGRLPLHHRRRADHRRSS